MKSFVRYDKSSNTLITESNRKIPDFCLKSIQDENKKCQNFYNKIISDCNEGMHKCPYGFYCYYKKNTIYTSIILKDKDNSKLNRTLKARNDKINNYALYSEEQLKDIMEDIDNLYTKNIELRDCMHDLRNMGGYFNSMSETIEMKHPELIGQDDDIKAMLSLYDLINYRLNVYYGIREADNKRFKGKLYPILRKLQIMMKYQAKKKKVNVKIDFEQKNTEKKAPQPAPVIKKYSILFENIDEKQYNKVKKLSEKNNTRLEVVDAYSNTYSIWKVYEKSDTGNEMFGTDKVNHIEDFLTQSDAVEYAKSRNLDALIKQVGITEKSYTVKLCCSELDNAKKIAKNSNITDKIIKIVRAE